MTSASMTLIRLQITPPLRPIAITWRKISFPFFKNRHGCYEAFLAVPLSTRPGPTTLTLLINDHGISISKTFQRTLHPRHDRTIVLRLKKRAHLTPILLKRIKKEKKFLHHIFAVQTPKRYWHGRFVKPVPGGVTSPFGTRRKINGTYISIHHGTDFRAPLKTPVKAINTGLVVYRGELLLSGKTVVVDHGWGLFSLYGHLSSFCVHEGDLVKKGQIIALSGNTGRTTGPHLHLGVILCGIPVDPLSLFHLSKRGLL